MEKCLFFTWDCHVLYSQITLILTSYARNSFSIMQSPSGQPDHDPVVVQQDTLVYADIGPSSFKNRGKPKVTLKPVDTDDRVEYALLNHRLQKQAITTNEDPIAGNIESCTQIISLFSLIYFMIT